MVKWGLKNNLKCPIFHHSIDGFFRVSLEFQQAYGRKPTQSHGNTWHCQVTSFNLFIRDLGQVISIFSCKKHKFQTLSKKKRWSSYLFSRRGLPTEQRTCTYIRELSQFLRIKGEIRNGWPKAVTLFEICVPDQEWIDLMTWQCHVFPWDWDGTPVPLQSCHLSCPPVQSSPALCIAPSHPSYLLYVVRPGTQCTHLLCRT